MKIRVTAMALVLGAAFGAELCAAEGPAPRHAVIHRLDLPSQPSPLATRGTVIGMARAGDRTIAVGEQGRILLSDDRGNSWRQARVPTSSPLVAVNFPTPKSGWAVGHDGVILHSSDAGETWERQMDGRALGPLLVSYYDGLSDQSEEVNRARKDSKRFNEEGPSKPFLDVFFTNERTGWVVGAFNLILRTDDGGKNWTPLLHKVDNKDGYSLNAIRAVGDDIFIVGELGLVRRYDRAQDRFVPVPTPYDGSFFGLIGSGDRLYIFGLRGKVLRSRDRGVTWEDLKQDTEAAFVGADLLPGGRPVFVSNSGEIWVEKKTRDAFGKQRATKSAEMLSAVVVIDGRHSIVSGERGVHLHDLDLHDR